MDIGQIDFAALLDVAMRSGKGSVADVRYSWSYEARSIRRSFAANAVIIRSSFIAAPYENHVARSQTLYLIRCIRRCGNSIIHSLFGHPLCGLAAADPSFPRAASMTADQSFSLR